MKPPKRGNSPVIDRSKFKDQLSRRLDYGNNVVATDTVGLTPEGVSPFGLKHYSGSLKNKDIVYKKGDSYYIYNEQPVGDKTVYGLVDIGNPFAVTSQPPTTVAAKPPQVIDPMKVPGWNGVLEPVVERYYKGGVVKKYNNYDVGGVVNTASVGTDLLGTYIENKDEPDELGRVNVNNQTWGQGIKSAGKGAATGAAIGSIIPGVGTAIGAGAGAIIGGVAGAIKGNKDAKALNEEIELAEEERIKEEKLRKAGMAVADQFSSRGFKDGGTIQGKGTGTSDSISAKVKPGSFVIPEKIATALKETIVRKAPKRAKLNQKGGTSVKLSDGEILLSPEDKDKLIQAGMDISAFAPEAEMWKGGKVPGYKKGGEPKSKDKEIEKRKYDAIISTKEKYNINPLDVPSAEEIAAAQKTSQKTPPKRRVPNVYTPEPVENLQAKTMTLPGSTQPEINPTITEIPSAAPGSPGATETQTGNGFNFNGLNQAIGYALPALQLYMGNKALKEAGPRPKDQLDPDYLDSIAKARKNLDLANAEAKFGFTQDEQFQIDQRNAGAYRDARFASRNFSGGSNANAFAMDRQSVNDYFTRGLEAKINNRKLQMAKKQAALEQQGYVDNLVAGKANMNRQLFQDDLNAWNQNQAAGSALIGSGLSNAIGASRYGQELRYMKDRDKKYGVNYGG